MSEFRRVHLFYTLFTAFYHGLFGLKNLTAERPAITEANAERLRHALNRVDELFAVPVPAIVVLNADSSASTSGSNFSSYVS